MSTRTILGMIAVSALMLGQAVAQVQVQAKVDQSRSIYAGSPFSYSIIVHNGGLPDNVDLAPLKSYNPTGPSSESHTSIIGRQTSSYQALNYELTAPSAGEYTIPSVTVTVDKKTYQTEPVTITVVKPGTTQKIAAQMELSTQQCYVGQPVIMTFSFYVWLDIVRSRQIANIGIQIPCLDDEAFYQEDLDLVPGGATKTVLPVNGQEAYVYQDQVRYDGVDCVRVRFSRVLIPKRDGTLNLDPASVTTDLAVGMARGIMGSRYKFDRFGVQSEPLQVTVRQLPQTGKPDGFYGLVGNYSISADATPKEVNVGDPITLTIRISGSQYLKPVQWPDLDKIPEMAESFKIPSERSDGDIQNDAKVFTQTIRPNHENVTQIPPIPLSFFDADVGKYRTVMTQPIPLQVSPTRIVTGGDVESHQFSSAKKQIKAIQEGLSANYTSSDALANQRFSLFLAVKSPIFIILYAVPFIVLIVSATIRYALADNPQRRAANKRKRAYSLAVKQVRYAGSHEKPSQQVLAALKRYVADKFAKSAGALTPQDCRTVILEKTTDTELSDLYQEIMEQTEASEYSPTAFKLTDEKQKEILGLLAAIEKKVK